MRSEGYALPFLGDFNGHLGPLSSQNLYGIKGDKCEKNVNGELLIEFVEDLGLKIFNGTEICGGLFTQVEGGRCSIVDYGCVEEDIGHFIDEKYAVAQGSDHSVLELQFELKVILFPSKSMMIQIFSNIRKE